MAESTLVLTYTWENDKTFKLVATKNGEDTTIVEMDENSYFNDIWKYAKSICQDCHEREIDVIGNAMKA